MTSIGYKAFAVKERNKQSYRFEKNVFSRKENQMRRENIVEKIRETANSMRPAVQTILYGSEARGEAREDSDIDLLILVDADKLTYEDKDKIMTPYQEIELETGILISTMIITRKEWENRPFRTPFYINVINEGIIL